MITLRFDGDAFKGSLIDNLRKLGWSFLYNHRGIPDRVVDEQKLLVAFNNTTMHAVELQFKWLHHAQQFMASLEEHKQ